MGRNNTDKSLQQTKQPLAQRVKKEVQRSWPMYVMLLPAIILALIFCYAPMGGLVMAFQNYKPWLGIPVQNLSDWIILNRSLNLRNLIRRS